MKIKPTTSLCLALGTLGLACSRESVDLGGDTLTQNLARGTRCAQSSTLTENVVVSNQEELDALSGCEEIEGNLIVRLFPSADLTPLSSLRVVEGQFALGVQQDWDEILGFFISGQLDSEVELLSAGWVASLDGVQALERVGALFLRGMPGADLRAFESLQGIGGSRAGVFQGQIILQQNSRLRSLAGLENVANARNLVVTLSDELESLSGIDAGSLQSVALYTSPQLSDLSALAPVSTLNNLVLYETGVQELSALQNLELLSGPLMLFGNPALVDASGLDNLQMAEPINIADNAALKVLPSFSNFYMQPSVITITGNAQLEQVSLDFSQAVTQVYDIAALDGTSEAAAFEVGPDVVDISNNAQLQSIEIPGGLTKVNLGVVQNNPSLVELDLGTLREVGRLSINGNAALSDVDPGALEHVSLLQVTQNPQLSAAIFADVQTFARDVHSNLE